MMSNSEYDLLTPLNEDVKTERYIYSNPYSEIDSVLKIRYLYFENF